MDEPDAVAGSERHLAELGGHPARAAEAERELSLLTRGEPQRDRVPSGDELDPAWEHDPDLQPVDRRLRANRDGGVELVALDGALAVEVDPRAKSRRVGADTERDEERERGPDERQLGPAQREGGHEGAAASHA